MVQVGQVLQQRYTLQQRLGRTAAGHSTWLATDSQTNEQVTVKLLAFSPQMEWNELKLFEREAEVLQSLHHSRIPRYRDYFDIDKDTGEGMPWFALVQDYIPGNSLQELLEQGYHFSPEQIRDIALQVLDILTYLHTLSPPVLHRDIKPSNLILGEDGSIYLIDFGAVQAQAAVTGVTFTVVGTSGYAPLEQFWGRAVPASDIYALGATLIHLLTGVTPAELPQKDGRIQFANRTNAKPNLIAWIQKATLSLEKRFHSATEALEALNSEELSLVSVRSDITQIHKSPKPKKTVSQVLHSSNPDKIKIKIPKLTGSVTTGSVTPFGIVSLMSGVGLGVIVAVSISLLVVLFIMMYPHLAFQAVFLGLFICSCIEVRLRRKNIEIELDPNFFKLTRRTYFGRWCISRVQSKCKLEDIRGVFLVEQERSPRQKIRIKTYWQSYNIKQKLKEEEAMWLVDEIRAWLTLYQSAK